MNQETFLKEHEYMDDYIKRRVYQLKNHEEIYKKYKNHSHDLERRVAMLELDLIELCNKILACGYEPTAEQFSEVHLEAIDLIHGAMDTEAIELMRRCDTNKKLEEIHMN